jgi:hypothetical protein
MLALQITYYGKDTRPTDTSSILQWVWLASLALQMLRPLRLLHLSHTFVGLRVVLMVIRKSLYELFTVFICLGIGMILFAFLIFASEITVEGTFNNIWDGLWWALITMTTVGYGDMTPHGWPGYLVGMACAVTGIIITGLSIPILSNNFNCYYNHVHIAMNNIKDRLAAARVQGTDSPERTSATRQTTATNNMGKRNGSLCPVQA